MWFNKNYTSTDNDIEAAKQLIDYLKKNGERVEKWAAVRTLSQFISKKILPNTILKEIIKLKWKKLNMKIATHADMEMIDYLIENAIPEQPLYANLLYNKEMTYAQAEKIMVRCDESDRGLKNKKAITRKFGIISPNEG